MTSGRLVVRAQQVGPRAVAHRLEIVLEHSEEGRVGFDQVALAADPDDADRRPLEDGPVVRLASPQRLRGVRAADELPDLDADCGQHGDLVVLDLARVLGQQLDDSDHGAAVHHWERDHGLEAGRARHVEIRIVGPARQVFDGRHDARLPDPAKQSGAEWN